MSVSLRVPAAVARASPRSARARVGRRRSSHPARSSATSGTSSTATTEDGKPAPPELASESAGDVPHGCLARTAPRRRSRGRAGVGDAGAEARRATLSTQTDETRDAAREQIGVDYEPFRALLEAGEWEKADDEHRRLMCVLAGEEAEDREWVYFTEVDNMPVTDLRTIDALWKYYSNGRFGFSVQRKIWIGQKRQWAKFFKKIDWTTGENGDYRKFPQEFQWRADAAQGHMPLTNALRGTQLLAALLEHPAFGPGLPERTSEGSFYEGTASRETPVRFEMPTVGGVLDVAVRFGKFGVLFAQELMK